MLQPIIGIFWGGRYRIPHEVSPCTIEFERERGREGLGESVLGIKREGIMYESVRDREREGNAFQKLWVRVSELLSE